jgi:hypothetical protein
LGETISTSLANTLAAETFAMTKEDDLYATIDLIYEAVLDDTLWPKALASLGDTIGAAHIVVSAMDRRARKCDSIAPRTDPLMEASYKKYWAFHDRAAGGRGIRYRYPHTARGLLRYRRV